jgi:hypothetical protein
MECTGVQNPAYRLWASADYLLWWVKSSPLPIPVVTTSNTTDLGVIGAPSTQVAIGNENLNYGAHSGARFTVGGWLGQEEKFGIEGSFFFLGSETVRRSAAVDGVSPEVIAVPFFDVTPGGIFGGGANIENSFVVGAPANLNNVLRPGNQLDRVINGGQSELYSGGPPVGLQGGPARPAAFLNESDFWAQGLSFGLEFRF